MKQPRVNQKALSFVQVYSSPPSGRNMSRMRDGTLSPHLSRSLVRMTVVLHATDSEPGVLRIYSLGEREGEKREMLKMFRHRGTINLLMAFPREATYPLAAV